MEIITTAIEDVLLIRPSVFEDERGFFLESYHQARFHEAGIRDEFVQDNHSRSTLGTLRGLHYQLTRPQAKLCRVIYGCVLDVVVDIRLGSPTFGRHVSAQLSAENKQQIYVPKGFAHGFVVLSDAAEFLYKCSDFYCPGDERGVLWSDPDLGIEWGVAEPVLSKKDRSHPPLFRISKSDLPRYLGV